MSVFIENISIVFPALNFIGWFLLSLWWIWIPWFLFLLARGFWYKYTRNKTEQNKEWILLELTPPRDIVKTAYGMEQFFTGIHGIQGGFNWWDRNVDGCIPDYFSMEVISQSGNIHFYIRTLKKFRDLVEAHIYAQYPETEIKQAPDYINSVPSDLPNDDYKSWGTELIFTKENAYPIRTHPFFEKDASIEEKRVDPLASLLEVMSKLKNGEQFWIQMLIRPVNDAWVKSSEEVRDKLIRRTKEKKESAIKKEIIGWKDASTSVAHQIATGNPFESSSGENKDDPRWKSLLDPLTRSEQETIKAIEEKMGKIGFEVIIREVYLAPKDAYREGEIKKAIVGCFKQFSTQNINGFRLNPKLTPGAVDYKIELAEPRNRYRAKKIFANYRSRFFVHHSKVIDWLKPVFYEHLPIVNWFFIRSEPIVLNIEELASIYHFPAITVKSPLTPKVESRKGEPPIGLPIQ